MKELIQSWEAYRPTKQQALVACVACVAATMVVGFGVFGWVTGGTAKEMADQAAASRYQTLAAAVCAEEFMSAKDAPARLAKLKAAEWYERDDLVLAGGWATMPGEKEGNGVVAELCATRLAEQADAAAKATPISVVR